MGTFWLVFFLSQALYAQIQYPVADNQIQILPLKLEYKYESHNLTLGNKSFNFKDFGITLKKNSELTFQGPNELKSGFYLRLQNHLGKELWSAKLTAKNSLKNSAAIASKNSNLSKWIFQINGISIIELAHLPYFKVCATKAKDSNYIYICSNEYFVENNEVKARLVSSKESTLSMNGQEIGPEGVIQLNKDLKYFLFQMNSAEGLQFDLRFDRPQIEVTEISTNSKAEITTMFYKWSTRSELEKISKHDKENFFYLENSIGIPFRQEFNPTQGIPNVESIKLDTSSKNETLFGYGPDRQLTLFVNSGVKVKPSIGEVISSDDGHKLHWSSDSLPPGQTDLVFNISQGKDALAGRVTIENYFGRRFSIISAAAGQKRDTLASLTWWFKNARMGLFLTSQQHFDLRMNFSSAILGRDNLFGILFGVEQNQAVGGLYYWSPYFWQQHCYLNIDIFKVKNVDNLELGVYYLFAKRYSLGIGGKFNKVANQSVMTGSVMF